MGYEEASFQILLYAGNAGSEFERAIELTEAGRYSEAQEAIGNGNEEMLKAHNAHADILTDLSNGMTVSCNILLIHAMDHMERAENRCFLAERILRLYKTIDELKPKSIGGKEGAV